MRFQKSPSVAWVRSATVGDSVVCEGHNSNGVAISRAGFRFSTHRAWLVLISSEPPGCGNDIHDYWRIKMKTFTVPVFLGVNAETKQEAIEKALGMLEYSLDIHEDNDLPYCYIGNINEVIEQEE